MRVLYKFTYEELKLLEDYFEHQYVSYSNRELHAVLTKISKITKAHEHELDKQSSLPTQGA